MKLKKNFLKFVKSKIIYIFSFLFVGLFLPLHFAFAIWPPGDWLDKIWRFITGLPMLIVLFPVFLGLYIFALISALWGTICLALLNWIININIPLTRCPTGVDCIVEFGWTITRDLANMFFILIFVAIAFAYILKLETFGMKKALPMLLAVALLINFSAVFVGIFVDIAQIIMSAFTMELSGLTTLFSPAMDYGGNIFSVALASPSLENNMRMVAEGIALIFFNIIIGLIFLMYALLFLIRIIALWILTIFAPLAFMALILPQTKGMWSKWFSNVIQWSFIGVIPMFFIFLGFKMLDFLTGAGAIDPSVFSSTASGGTDLGLTTTLMALLPYIMLCVFLFIGFTLAISGTPAAAQGVMNMAKQQGQKFAKAGGRRVKNKALTSRRGKAATQKMVQMENIIPAKLGGKTRIGKALGAGPTWGIRAMGRMGQGVAAEAPGNVDKEMTDKKLQDLVKNKQFDALAAHYNGVGISDERKIAIASLLFKHKGQEARAILGQKNTDQALGLAAQYSKGHLKDMVAADPDLAKTKTARGAMIDPKDKKDKRDIEKTAQDMGMEESRVKDAINEGESNQDYKAITEKLAYHRAVKGLTSDQIENLSDETLRNEDFQREFVLTKGPSAVEKVSEKHGPEYVQMFDEMRHKIGSKKLAEENPAMFKASLAGPMRHLFTHMKNEEGETINDANKANNYIANIRETQPKTTAKPPDKETTEILAAQIRQKRMNNQPGYEYDKIDAMLREQGIEPGSAAATNHMQKWDWEQAEKMLNEGNNEAEALPETPPEMEGDMVKMTKNIGKQAQGLIKNINAHVTSLKQLKEAASNLGSVQLGLEKDLRKVKQELDNPDLDITRKAVLSGQETNLDAEITRIKNESQRIKQRITERATEISNKKTELENNYGKEIQKLIEEWNERQNLKKQREKIKKVSDQAEKIGKKDEKNK